MVVILLLVPSSTSSTSLTTTTTYTNSISISQQPKHHVTNSSSKQYYCYGSQPPPQLTHQSSTSLSVAVAVQNAAANSRNFNREYVNHVTRINICSQIEASSGEPEAIVKEGECIHKFA
jgi:hypothetical protein